MSHGPGMKTNRNGYVDDPAFDNACPPHTNDQGQRSWAIQLHWADGGLLLGGTLEQMTKHSATYGTEGIWVYADTPAEALHKAIDHFTDLGHSVHSVEFLD